MENKISRRDALKRMGVAVVSGAMASSGLLSFPSCTARRAKRIILYFTATGNCLHIARELAEEAYRAIEHPTDDKAGTPHV